MAGTLLESLSHPEFTDTTNEENVQKFFNKLRNEIESKGYKIVDEDTGRPWGAFFRFSNDDAVRFLKEFFPGDTPSGDVSPKILIVLHRRRLSLQTHERRAEKWLMITRGKVVHGMTLGSLQERVVEAGSMIQFEAGEIHRLCGDNVRATLVAEQWQHIDSSNPSDEADITRLVDDYQRSDL